MSDRFDELGDQLRRDIGDFIEGIKDDVLKVVNGHPTTVLGIRHEGVSNPFYGFLHGKLQQEARENPEYNVLAASEIVTVDPHHNGLPSEYISGRVVVAVEESYSGPTVAYLQRIRRTTPPPLSIYYATAKPLQLAAIESGTS